MFVHRVQRRHRRGRIDDARRCRRSPVREPAAVRQPIVGSHVAGVGEPKGMAELPLPGLVAERRRPPTRRPADAAERPRRPTRRWRRHRPRTTTTARRITSGKARLRRRGWSGGGGVLESWPTAPMDCMLDTRTVTPASYGAGSRIARSSGGPDDVLLFPNRHGSPRRRRGPSRAQAASGGNGRGQGAVAQ